MSRKKTNNLLYFTDKCDIQQQQLAPFFTFSTLFPILKCFFYTYYKSKCLLFACVYIVYIIIVIQHLFYKRWTQFSMTVDFFCESHTHTYTIYNKIHSNSNLEIVRRFGSCCVHFEKVENIENKWLVFVSACFWIVFATGLRTNDFKSKIKTCFLSYINCSLLQFKS